MSLSEDITDASQLSGKKGIGPNILKKLQEFQETGKIEFIEEQRKIQQLRLQMFTESDTKVLQNWWIKESPQFPN